MGIRIKQGARNKQGSRIKRGMRLGMLSLRGALSLMRQKLPATLLLGALLALLPQLLMGALSFRANFGLFSTWERWMDGQMTGGFLRLVNETLALAGNAGPPGFVLTVAASVFLTPWLFAALAVLYMRESMGSALSAVRCVWTSARRLVVAALCCALAEYFVQFLPSFAIGFLSAVIGLLSLLLPLAGGVLDAVTLSLVLVIYVATDMLVAALFGFVYIALMQEGATGFSAIARSFSILRGVLPDAAWSLVLLTLVRGATLALMFAAWVVFGRELGPLPLILGIHALTAVAVVLRGALFVYLYQRRPHHADFGSPDVSRLKRANVD